MDRNLIRLTVEDINLTEIENSVLLQTAGETDIIFDDGVMEILIEKYLEMCGYDAGECECNGDSCVGCGDGEAKEIW